jgi:uncharacterized protein (UPF0548 family)
VLKQCLLQAASRLQHQHMLAARGTQMADAAAVVVASPVVVLAALSSICLQVCLLLLLLPQQHVLLLTQHQLAGLPHRCCYCFEHASYA